MTRCPTLRWVAVAGLLSACASATPDDETVEASVFEVDGPSATSDDDQDGDGVLSADDCDDGDAAVGALLYANALDADDGHLAASPALDDAWSYREGAVGPEAGGQQALLGEDHLWGDTVSFVTLSADGALADGEDTDRYRAGLLARVVTDPDLDTGFSGYRCAAAANAGTDDHEAGPFVQIAAFTDGDGFVELSRAERSEDTPLLAGAEASLAFWLVGDSLDCVFHGEHGEQVTATITDERMASGGAGLSTLNALAAFDDLRVCQALSRPR